MYGYTEKEEEILKSVLAIKKYCAQTKDCNKCLFINYFDDCILLQSIPGEWDVQICLNIG